MEDLASCIVLGIFIWSTFCHLCVLLGTVPHTFSEAGSSHNVPYTCDFHVCQGVFVEITNVLREAAHWIWWRWRRNEHAQEDQSRSRIQAMKIWTVQVAWERLYRNCDLIGKRKPLEVHLAAQCLAKAEKPVSKPLPSWCRRGCSDHDLQMGPEGRLQPSPASPWESLEPSWGVMESILREAKSGRSQDTGSHKEDAAAGAAGAPEAISWW